VAVARRKDVANIRPLEEHSFSSNSGAGGMSTLQQKIAKSVGWAGKPILAIASLNDL